MLWVNQQNSEQIKKIRDNYIKIINDYEQENLKNMEKNKQKAIDYKVELDIYINELKKNIEYNFFINFVLNKSQYNYNCTLNHFLIKFKK